jgi:hypothetical protein
MSQKPTSSEVANKNELATLATLAVSADSPKPALFHPPANSPPTTAKNLSLPYAIWPPTSDL